MTLVSSVPSQSSSTNTNGKPVVKTVHNPQPSETRLTKSEMRETKAALLENKNNKARNEIHDVLAAFGSKGKPTYDMAPDGKQNLLGRTERSWDSSEPNHDFIDAYVSGDFGKDQDHLEDSFDAEAHEDAKEVLAAWCNKPPKTVKGDIWYDGLRHRFLSERTTYEGCCEPPPAIAEADVMLGPAKGEQPRVEPPSVSVELTEALSKRTSKVNGDLLNAIYERYLLDAVGEKGNLRVALFVHARNRYYGRLDKTLVGGMMTAEEIISDFSGHVLQKIEDGKYPNNDGKLAGWVAVCWSNYSSKYKKAFFKEASFVAGVKTTEACDMFGELCKDKKGYVPLRDVEKQRYRRNCCISHASDDPNSAKKRVERIIRDLDDPSTEFGKLDADTKQIIRELNDGKSIDAVSKSVGLCTRQVSRKLKQLRSMKGQSFLRVSSNYLLDTDDVVKGGVLYTVQTADFEREVGR